MDSSAENTSARVMNRDIGQLVIVSGVAALLPPSQEDEEQSAGHEYQEEEGEDEVIEVGSDSEVDEGSRCQFEVKRSFLPSPRHHEGGGNSSDASMDVEQRQAAVEVADPIMTPEMAGHGRVEGRGRTRTALEVHFGEEEEEDTTGSYIGNQMTDQLQTVLDSFEKRLSALEKSAGVEVSAGARNLGSSSNGATAKVEVEVPAFVKDFDDYCTTYLDPFVAACEELGGGAASGGAVVKKAWGAQRDFLVMAAACKKPDQAAMMERMKPLQECMKEGGGNRTRDEFENHTRAVEEAMGCVSWLIMGPPAGLPKEVVEPMIGGSDYWANKVRMKYRSTNPDQVAFCDTLKALLTHLLEYVLSHHKTGVSWNPKGGDVSAYPLSEGGGAKSAPPVPPPMPPPASVSAAPARPPMNALFGEISKGLGVTKGLKKVERHQQTWRSEYKTEGAAPVAHAASSSKPSPKPSTGPKGPPKMEFVQHGMKWIVENQGSSEGVVTIDIANIKHQVYIYGCVGATIDIKGKCKMVAIDGCNKTQVLLDDAISSVELVNCQRMKVQVRGAVPSVAVDKTDGFLCYLSEAGLSTKFVTSKSSEMNVAFPKPGTEDEQMEVPIPEQFQHVLELEPSPHISSDVSDLYSH